MSSNLDPLPFFEALFTANWVHDQFPEVRGVHRCVDRKGIASGVVFLMLPAFQAGLLQSVRPCDVSRMY